MWAGRDAIRARHEVLKTIEVGTEHFGFRLCLELGRGAFARVFLAEQVDLAGRHVVLKVSASDDREPELMAQMQHTHIAPIYSIHEDAQRGIRGVCMPYFGGATLQQVLEELWKNGQAPKSGQQLVDALLRVQAPVSPTGGTSIGEATRENPLTWLRGQSFLRASVWVVLRLAEALRHAHQRGVIHSDIKPSNILLAADGQPLLLDFNVARRRDSEGGALGGTVAYAAPEHVRVMAQPTPANRRLVDARSDLYSLGLVLYTMIVGSNPFEQTTSEQELDLEKLRPLSARSRRSDVPWSLESVLRKCLAVNPSERYLSADELVQDLGRFLSDEPLRYAPELSRVERARKWVRRHPRLTSSGTIAAAAVLLLASAGLVLHSIQGHLRQTRHQLQLSQAEERQQAYERGTLRALCLVNTVTDLPGFVSEGARVCETTLGLYGVLDREDWQQQPDWTILRPETRSRLNENTRELLLLLAWSRVRSKPNDDATLRHALSLLDRAEHVDAGRPSQALWLSRANYLERLGEQDKARAARRQADEVRPATAQDHYLLATTYARQGTAEGMRQALAELDRALALNPRHYWALAQRGMCRQEQGNLSLAIADFSTCVGLWPDFAWGYFNRGQVLGQAGQRAQALVDFTAAIDRDPQFVAAYLNRGLLQLETKQYVAALADFDAARQLGRDDAFLHAGRGMALEGLRRHEEADAAFEEGFARIGDLDDTARSRILWAYGFAVSQRQPERAKKAFEEIHRKQPRQPQALYGLALCAIEKDELEEGLRFLDEAVQADPSFVDARRGRAIVHARAGRLQEASQDINWCLDREPGSGVTLYAAACVAARAAGKSADRRMARQAFDLLGKAFELDYGQEKAADDPDLRALRHLPEFEQLLKRRATIQAVAQ